MDARQILRKISMLALWILVSVGLIFNLYLPTPVKAAVQSNGCIVAFDPGHGGNDPGATRGAILEKDINWKVSNLAADILRNNGFGVIFDRAENQNPGFGERVGVAKQAKAILMVSVHANSHSNPSSHGTEAWYQPKEASESRRLAQLLTDTVASRAGLSNRGVKIGKSPFSASLSIALIEMAFLSNENERNMMVNNPNLFAQAIADAVIKFTETKCSMIIPPPTGFKDGDIVYLKTLGIVEGPRWLDGRTGNGTVGLAPETTGGYTGTRWQLADLGGGTFGLKTLGSVEGPRWLDGRTGNGTVGLAPETTGGYTGTHWQLVDLGGGTFGLKCLGSVEGPRWLDGRTGNGTVGLAPETTGGYTGTHWQIIITR